MTVTQLDLGDYGDNDEVPGYSATAGELRKLPFADQLTRSGSAGSSARLLAEQWHKANPEPQQDTRLRVGSPADQHKAAVAAALRDGGYLPLEAGALNRFAASIEPGANIASVIAQRGFPKAPARARSADTVLRRRI